MRDTLILGTLALSAAALFAGCYGQAAGHTEVDAPVVVADEPTLVAVDSDVWVVRDNDDAVYYVDDYYWVYRDDAWQRSQRYDGGWATVEVSVVPRQIVSRDHRAYVHYRGAPNAPTRKAPREGGDDRERRADEHRDLPPGRDKDKDARPPEHADERHSGPPDRDKVGAPRPDPRSGDRDAPPKPGDRPGVNPPDEHAGRRDNVKSEEPGKRDEKKANDNKTPDKDDHKRAQKKEEHEK